MSKLVTIEFRDDTLFTLEDAGAVYVAVKPISDALGLKWSGQHERINRDPILAEGIRVMGIPSPGGSQDTTCLRLDLMQGWLFGIDAARVRPEARERVLAYKRECYAALHAHFYGRKGEAPKAISDSLSRRRQLVTECRHSHGVKAARELWHKLGLPTVPAMNEPPRQMTLDFASISQRSA